MVLFNIPGDTKEVAEGKLVGVFGNNGAGHATFIGPCPPPQYEPKEHRYFFHLYALDTEIPLITGASKESVESRMVGHVLDESKLMARYARIQK